MECKGSRFCCLCSISWFNFGGHFSCHPFVWGEKHLLILKGFWGKFLGECLVGFNLSTQTSDNELEICYVPYCTDSPWALFFEHDVKWCSRWWFQIVFIFTPIWGRFPCWLIFFKGVETTNQPVFDNDLSEVDDGIRYHHVNHHLRGAGTQTSSKSKWVMLGCLACGL